MSLLLLGLVVGSATIACVGLMVLVRRSTSHHLVVDVERGVGVLQLVGTAFAVLLAFIVFIAFDSYNQAKGAAESEANDMVEVSRNLHLLKDSSRTLVPGELICYGRAVVNFEWPALRHRHSSPLVDVWEARLRNWSKTIDTSSPANQAALQEIVAEFDAIAEARRIRITESHPVVPQPIWVVLILGGLLIVSIMLLLADPDESPVVQGLLMAAVSTMLASSLALIWFLDHPYRNQPGSLKPTEMTRSIQIIERENPAQQPPCTPLGRPA